ncbi:DUF6543 domain-containing protein [Pseudomonas sp. T1.Ur]|uniref:dermonecrotic toxin domain-containing protein n=1 Tax=Pseudomonas sp. T1.Ur TaxID=2928704 RepID=UPI00201E18E1|nr:DUF6543 domain-containing protein [Pseudomonas sp. T1.Ur]MCL6702447.1 hypothetical protein [Pseudomonas sp. T1.Ur]
MKERYPSLTIDLSKTRLATPEATANSYRFQSLMGLVLDYLALGKPVDFKGRRELRSFLTDQPPRQLHPRDGRLDMKVIEQLVLELPWTVSIGLEDALVRYWNEGPDRDSQTGPPESDSRWGWLSTALKNALHLCALQQAELTEPAREALDQIVRWPNRDTRMSQVPPVYAYRLETTLTQGDTTTVLSGSDIVLLHYTRVGLVVLLCSPGRPVQSFSSLDSFRTHWAEWIAGQYIVDAITCGLDEIDGNVFDTQAAMILEQQLTDLRAVQLPSRFGLQRLGELYNELSDPSHYLLDTPHLSPSTSDKLSPLLPDWLRTAPLVDQTRFQHYGLTLASAKKRNDGRTFLSDIKDIRRFAADALIERMRQPAAMPNDDRCHPDEVQLTFTIAAGYPGTSGVVEKHTMSLTDLAIDNLIARRSGRFKLSHRRGLAIPAWLTPDFITRKDGLIEQVDIGRTYPGYLKEQLLASPHVQQRQRLFAEQIPSQLALEALKQVHSQEDGMTGEGLALLEALLEPEAGEQQVNGRAVVIRTLAFLRKPQALPDAVANMYLMEHQDLQTGPHLLYRPLYTPSLQQFPTRRALFEAIATPGELQNSILTWLSDAARPIYANGGFREPHIIRFLQGDEFDLPPIPARATVATDEVSEEIQQYLRKGELMQYLYGANARALIAQANQESVSNSESRWAVLLEGGSLLFQTLLMPLLRGPAMAAAWLWTLMAGASHDIQALNSEDPLTRELAAIDLLINLSMLVHQFPAISAPVHAPPAETLKEQAMRSPAPRTVAEQWPAPASPRVLEGTVTLPGEDSGVASSALDLSFANARHRLTSGQRAQLNRLQVPRPASLPEPIEQPPYVGLHSIDGRWYALVDEQLYQVRPEADGSATIVDPLDPARSGPPLQSDDRGRWSLDFRLRLRGGMPPKRIAQMRRSNTQRFNELALEFLNFEQQHDNQIKAADVALEVMKKAHERSDVTQVQRAQRRAYAYKLLEEQVTRYQRLLDAIPEYTRLGGTLRNDFKHFLMQNIVINARKAFVVVEMDFNAEQAAHVPFTRIETAPGASIHSPREYVEYLERICDINDRGIHWLELKDRYLDELFNLDSAGVAIVRKMTEGRQGERSAPAVKVLHLPALAALANIHDPGLPSLLQSIVNMLEQQIRSHADLRMYELQPSEEFALLDSLTQHYGQNLDALRGIKALRGSESPTSYLDRIINLVEGLYEEVSAKLALHVKPEPQPRKRLPKLPGRVTKKIIKTRKNGLLIGDMTKVDPTSTLEVVELRSEVDDHVMASYTQHGDVWDIVEEHRPAPTPQMRSVNTIKGEARKLLNDVEERLGRAEGYKKYCRYPQEIEEILINEANRYGNLSEELNRALTATQGSWPPADQELMDTLSSVAGRLSAKGRDLRIELSLALPPTDGALQYLLESDNVQIARIEGRKPLRKDFFQEYAINDRNGSPIWYAHFHYEKIDTPKEQYSVAHLKTKAQRREHYHSMLAKADSPYAVVNVHRGSIGKALATQKFLPLAP